MPPAAPYIFRRCFRVIGNGTVNVNFVLTADNAGQVLIDDLQVGTTVFNTTNNAAFQNPTNINVDINLTDGLHYIYLNLFNAGSVTGIRLFGSLSSSEVVLLDADCNMPAPIANAGNDTTICANDPIKIGTQAVAGNTYSWSPATGLDNPNIAQPTVNISETTTYTLTVTNVNGIDNDDVTVTVNPKPTLIVTNPIPVCEPSTVNLNDPAITSGSTPDLVYTYWTDAAATIPYVNYTSAASGTYYIKGTNTNNCSDIKPVVVTIHPQPIVVTSNPINVCEPSTVNLSDPAITNGSTSDLVYTYWRDVAATIPYVNYTSATSGTYYIKGTNSNNCSDIKPFTVTVHPIPQITSIVSNCTGGTLNSVTVFANTASGTLEYSCDGGEFKTNNTFSNLNQGTEYTFVVRVVGSTCTAT